MLSSNETLRARPYQKTGLFLELVRTVLGRPFAHCVVIIHPWLLNDADFELTIKRLQTFVDMYVEENNVGSHGIVIYRKDSVLPYDFDF